MKRVVLAGGGHAHLHVLKSLATVKWPDTEIVLVSPYARQVYSGMLPGWIAGHYRLEECTAPLAPLARAAGVRLIQDHIVGMDARQRVIRCADAGEIGYDLLSLNIGAQAGVSSLAATGAALLSIRPLERFLVDWTRRLAAFVEVGRARVAVVGGGAAGVELALAIRYRLATLLGAEKAEVFLVEGSSLLAGHGAAVMARVGKVLAAQGVHRLPGHATGTDEGLLLADATEVAVDCVVAATGISPPAWLAESVLALADDGFIAVGSGQQSTSHASVFAAGDIASRVDAPHAKSGVYAVRAGPVLAANLPRVLAEKAIVPSTPQRRSLYLLATGPRRAIASWNGWTAEGAWVWRWKDWIDRRFMKQYEPAKGACLGTADDPLSGL